ncbi:MAG TPA: DUF3106 domain-containing protein [Methylomirabilota bacterium]|nr:DUF3106 domain-containing protein [Methylomirabilota bacterium]
MKRFPQTIIITLCIVWSAARGIAQAANEIQPPLPPSPVELFRSLMVTNAAAREQFLASKSPQARRIIEAKLREYEGMMAEQREARLRALKLRWSTLQLMRVDPEERARRLANVPPPDRKTIEERLGPFIILPPGLQQEVLSNSAVMSTLAQGFLMPNSERVLPNMSEQVRQEELRKQQLLGHFKEFFELPAGDQHKALARLTPTEREQMEKTLSNFGSLSKQERSEAIEGFKKFAELSPVERAAFLETALRWRTMSEKDRALWRKIVARLQSPAPPPPLPNASAGRPRPDPSALLSQTN